MRHSVRVAAMRENVLKCGIIHQVQLRRTVAEKAEFAPVCILFHTDICIESASKLIKLERTILTLYGVPDITDRRNAI
jgi:hypothetical protein